MDTSTARLQCRKCHRLFDRPADYVARPLVAWLESVNLLSCPACGHGSAWENWMRETNVKGTITSGECGVTCQQATTAICKCSCGGSAHGRG